MEKIAKKKKTKKSKNTKDLMVKISKSVAIIILALGVAIFELPVFTLDEVIGSISLIGMILAVVSWIK